MATSQGFARRGNSPDERSGSDAQPWTDGAAGRREAIAIDWASALAAHDRWLRLVVRARLAERQAVDEVMQEVALAAVSQKSPLIDPGKVASWLYRLAVRQALLYRRRCGRRHRLVERYADRSKAPLGASTEADPLDWLLCDERARLVRQALGRLPPRDAEILMLKYTEDWSYRELAEHLGVSLSAVEARLHRARRKLRDALAGSNVIEVRE